MSYDDRADSARDNLWIAPGTGLCFSVIVALLAPRYGQWFGDAMPAFTHRFLAAYPIWIVVCLLAVILKTVSRTLDQQAKFRLVWRMIDIALSIASVLIIAVGIIALMLPILLRPMPA